MYRIDVLSRSVVPFVLTLACGTSPSDARSITSAPQPRDEITADEETDTTPLELEHTLTIEPMSACWLRPDARIACWGRLDEGAHGDPFTVGPADRMMRLANEPWPDRPRMLAGFGERRCAVTSSGTVRCWGHLFLSHAHLFSRHPPGDVIALEETGLFDDHEPCVLGPSGPVRCFRRTPAFGWVRIANSEGADALVTTDALVCVRKGDRRIHCTNERNDTVTAVEGPTNVEEIGRCGLSICAREANGRLWRVHRSTVTSPREVSSPGVDDALALHGDCIVSGAAASVACAAGCSRIFVG